MVAFLQFEFVTMLDTIKRPLFQFMGCDSLRVLIYSPRKCENSQFLGMIRFHILR